MTTPTSLSLSDTSSGSTPYVEGEPGTVLVDPTLTISPTTALINHATITINGVLAGDDFDFISRYVDSRIHIGYSKVVNGVLTITLSSKAGLNEAIYQKALDNLTFSSNFNSAIDTNLQVTYSVANGSTTSNSLSHTVQEYPENEKINLPTATTQLENTAVTFPSPLITNYISPFSLETVFITATNGTLSLGSNTKGVVVLGNGTHNFPLILTGSLANIDAALNSLQFHPTTNFTGTANVTISAGDFPNFLFNHFLATATETITYTGLPMANNVAVTGTEGTPTALTTIPITLSGSEVGGGIASFVIDSTPAHGTLQYSTLNATSNAVTINYLANYYTTGTVSFTYQAEDNQNHTSLPATVTIAVAPNVTAPSAPFATAEDTAVNGSLVPFDITTVSKDTVMATSTTPLDGSVTFDSSGGFIYQPNLGFFGTDSFQVNLTDTSQDTTTSAQAMDTITVNVAAAAVTANAVTQPATENGSAVSINLGNAVSHDPNNTDVTFSFFQAGTTIPLAMVGSTYITPDGSFTFNSTTDIASYTANPNVTGTDTFSYDATVHSVGGSATVDSNAATVTVNIAPENTLYILDVSGGEKTIDLVDGISQQQFTSPATLTNNEISTGAVFDPINGNVYVANLNNTYSIIHGTSLTTVSMGSTSTDPINGSSSIAFNPDLGTQGYLYFGGQTVSFPPGGAETFNEKIVVFDASNNQMVGTPIDLNAVPSHMAYDPSNQDLYVIGQIANGSAPFDYYLNVINTTNNSVISTTDLTTKIGGSDVFPAAITYDSADQSIYITGNTTLSQGMIVAIAGTNADPTSTFNVFDTSVVVPGTSITFDPVNDYLYVTSNANKGEIDVYNASNINSLTHVTTIPDATSGTTTQTVPTGITYDSVTNNIYVSNEQTGTVSVIDGNSSDASYNTIINTIPISSSPGTAGAPTVIVSDPPVANTAANTPAVVTSSQLDGSQNDSSSLTDAKLHGLWHDLFGSDQVMTKSGEAADETEGKIAPANHLADSHDVDTAHANPFSAADITSALLETHHHFSDFHW